MKLNNERTLHSLKTALACLLGIFITQTIQVHINPWIIITILVVMCAQPSVGSVIQKAYMRFFGTLCGSLLSIFTLLLFGSDTVAISIMILIATILFSYLATGKSRFNEAGTLGAATTVIILMGTTPDLSIALDRTLEISIGILIAALVSQFVFPIHARAGLRLNQAKTIRELRSFYLATLSDDHTEREIHYYQELDEKIVASLLAQRKLATDAGREVLGRKFNLMHFKTILTCEKEILRSISFMSAAYEEAPNRKKMFSNIYKLREFHDAVSNALLQIAENLERKNKHEEINITLPSIEILKNNITASLSQYSVEEAEYPHAYLFCAEILIAQLKKLIDLIAEIKSNFVSRGV